MNRNLPDTGRIRREEVKMEKAIEAGKRPWRKPELVVLVRTHPEEAVLTLCKTPTAPVAIKNKPTCSANACKPNRGAS